MPPPSVHIKFFKENDQSGPATPFYRVEAEKEIRYLGLSLGIITMDKSADTILASIWSLKLQEILI